METPMREKITQDLKVAMKAGDRAKVDALRLINAALKDKDIEARGAGKTLTDDDLLALLQKMIKSRQESLDIYEKAGRADLADKEKGEIAVISAYLPQQLSESEVADAVAAAIAEVGAASIKDMGKVVATLKAKYTGRMDFGKASAAVKAALGGGGGRPHPTPADAGATFSRKREKVGISNLVPRLLLPSTGEGGPRVSEGRMRAQSASPPCVGCSKPPSLSPTLHAPATRPAKRRRLPAPGCPSH
jgi:uncharacterized protein YqeY